MLAFERRMVGALLSAEDPTMRRAVIDYVDGTLAAMPEVVRAGIAGETVVLAAWARARAATRRPSSPVEQLTWLDAHPVGLVRQWVRALRSLVLFAENEMADDEPDPAPAAAR